MNAYYEKELASAIKTLGKHWVLHPDNRVPKLAEPLPENFKWTPKVLKAAHAQKKEKAK